MESLKSLIVPVLFPELFPKTSMPDMHLPLLPFPLLTFNFWLPLPRRKAQSTKEAIQKTSLNTNKVNN